MKRVEGKKALVTGGGSGLGAAMCELLAKEGAQIAVTDIDQESAQKVAEEIVKQGGKAISLKLDVTSEDEWDNVVNETAERFGGLDIVVNNAGIVIPGNVEQTTLDDWRKTQAINLDGVFLGTRMAISKMKGNGGGSIINISSIEGLIGEPMAAAYNASKGGVRIFSKSAALHCASKDYNIRVNSVHPGYVLTPLLVKALGAMEPEDAAAFQARVMGSIPMGKMGETIDVAYGVLYLASDESKYVTGSEMIIDGGYTAR